MLRAVVFAAVGLVVMACSSSEESTTQTTSQISRETVDESGNPAATAPPLATTAPAGPSSLPSTTTTTSTEPVGITRPFVDPSICEATTRWGTDWGGDAAGEEWRLFARSSADPIAVQIFAQPELGPTGPYAMVLRYPDRRADAASRETEPIGDFDVALDVLPHGHANAFWNLDDGGEGYLRARGLDRVTVIGIIEGLTVPNDEVGPPGFDYTPQAETSTGIELLHEGIWKTPSSGSYAAIECATPDGQGSFRIGATHELADPSVEYAFVSDRPAPIEVGYRDGSLIVINGPSDRPNAPTLDDVHNADDMTWTAIPSLD